MDALCIDQPSGGRAVFQLAAPRMTIGRDATSNIVLNDVTVSRQHCEVVVTGEGFAVSDLGSKGGTFLNGARVGKSQPIQPGDVLLVGATRFRYVRDDNVYLLETTGSGVTTDDPRDYARTLPEAEKARFERAFAPLVGESSSMHALRRMLWRAARFDPVVLLLGPSGAGKELCARAIHDASDRVGRPFLPVNMGAMASDDKCRSELFGHAKGSFTGADRTHVGAFESAGTGTIFLDEIGECPAATQTLLLRVLDPGAREFARLGESAMRRSDARVIAGTNRDLRELVKDGRFREDLYYRLACYVIHVPSLAERREDVPLIVQAVLAEERRKPAMAKLSIAPDTMAMLARREYPGNVRELRQIVQAAAVNAEGGLIRAEHLPRLTSPANAAAQQGATSGDPSLEAAEKEHVARVLATCGWNKSRAAKELGIGRNRLDRKIDKYGLMPPGDGA